MKIFKFLTVAIVATLGFSSCDNDNDNNWINVDYNKELTGTWTCIDENYAEAFVISADGSILATGFDGDIKDYWENVEGTIKVVNNKMTIKLENREKFGGNFEIIPGEAFSIVNEAGVRLTFRYCKNDLADEVAGMWVCNDAPAGNNNMLIQTFDKDGNVTMTGYSLQVGGFLLNSKATYKVIGDLMIHKLPETGLIEPIFPYTGIRLVYTPNGTALGDILTMKEYMPVGDEFVETPSSWLRVKQSLNITDNKYSYSSTYVSNVKGVDEDITIMGYPFNIAKMDGSNLDKMLKHLLFSIELSSANTIKYNYHYNGQKFEYEAPVEIEGNKVTIKVSEITPAYRDVEVYMFQDSDDCQLHIYMPTYSFINYFANSDIAILAKNGEIDLTDDVAVNAVFDSVAERVESINLSVVLKAGK